LCHSSWHWLKIFRNHLTYSIVHFKGSAVSLTYIVGPLPGTQAFGTNGTKMV
jgi:hypothetical protein